MASADDLEHDIDTQGDQRVRYLDSPVYAIDRPVTIAIPAGGTLDLSAARFFLLGAGQLRFDLGDGARVVGIVDVQGALLDGVGAAPPSNRTVRDAVVLVSGHRARFDGFRIQNVIGWAVRAEGHLIGADLGDCTFLDCGVGWHPSRPHYGGQVTLELARLEGGLGSPVQRAVFRRASGSPIADEAIVQFDGRTFHQVCIEETVAQEQTAFPWPPPPHLFGVPCGSYYWQGGGLRVVNGNTAQLRVRSLAAYRCAIGVHDRSLYGVRISSFTCEATGLGWVYGNQAPAAAPLGALIDGWHPEATYRAGVCCALKGRAWIEHTVVPVSRLGRDRLLPTPDGYRLEHLTPYGAGLPYEWPFLSPEGA